MKEWENVADKDGGRKVVEICDEKCVGCKMRIEKGIRC